MRFDSTTWMFPALQYSSSAYDGQISIKTQTKHWKWPLSWPTTKILRYAHTNLLHKHHDTVHWIHARQTQETCSGINSNQNEICAKSLSNLSLDLSSSRIIYPRIVYSTVASIQQIAHSCVTAPPLQYHSCTAAPVQHQLHSCSYTDSSYCTGIATQHHYHLQSRRCTAPALQHLLYCIFESDLCIF